MNKLITIAFALVLLSSLGYSQSKETDKAAISGKNVHHGNYGVPASEKIDTFVRGDGRRHYLGGFLDLSSLCGMNFSEDFRNLLVVFGCRHKSLGLSQGRRVLQS